MSFLSCVLRRTGRLATTQTLTKTWVTLRRCNSSLKADPAAVAQFVEKVQRQSSFKSAGHENSFAYSIVKQAGIPEISPVTPVIEQLKRNGVSTEEVTKVIGELDKLSTEELVALIDVLDTRYRDTDVFPQFYKALDLEGSKRVPNGDPAVVLAGALKLYTSGLFYQSEWIWSCLKRFCRRPDRLQVPQMLQVMFLVNLMRNIPVQYSGFDVQHYLVPFFDALSLNQMALVAVAFFKSQTRMNNKVIMSKIMRKLLEECETCDGFALAMICKIIRYSLPLSLADELWLLQDRLTSCVAHIDPRCLTHVALSGTNVLICHHGLIREIAAAFTKVIHTMRLKDMERILHVFSLFNIRDDQLVEAIIKELPNRTEEIRQFPKALVCLTNYLVMMQNFQFDLIDRVLSMKFIEESYSHSFKKMGGELIFIDKTVEIERPDYNGNRLKHNILKNSAKVMTFSAQDQVVRTGTQRFSYEVEAVLGQAYGQQPVRFLTLLPHFHFPDLLLGFDSGLRPIGPPEAWTVHRWGEIKWPPDGNHGNKGNVWMPIVVGGWNTFVRNENRPLGSMLAKLRHLRMIGYHPVLVPYMDWRNSKDKLSYVKSLIEPVLLDAVKQKAVTTR